jgi:hypothetical protein
MKTAKEIQETIKDGLDNLKRFGRYELRHKRIRFGFPEFRACNGDYIDCSNERVQFSGPCPSQKDIREVLEAFKDAEGVFYQCRLDPWDWGEYQVGEYGLTVDLRTGKAEVQYWG